MTALVVLVIAFLAFILCAGWGLVTYFDITPKHRIPPATKPVMRPVPPTDNVSPITAAAVDLRTTEERLKQMHPNLTEAERKDALRQIAAAGGQMLSRST